MNDQHGEDDQAQQHIELSALQPGNIKNGALHEGAMQPARLSGHTELAQLGQENNDGESIHKAQHNRMRHHANEFTEFQCPGGDLQYPHQHYRGKQILHTMVGHQSDHNHGKRTGGPGYHAGSTANAGGDQAHHKRRIQTYQGLNTGHKRECYRLRHEGQCDGQPGQNIVFRGGNLTRLDLKHHKHSTTDPDHPNTGVGWRIK